MKRRTFVKNGLMVCSAPFIPLSLANAWEIKPEEEVPERPAWLVKMIKLNDERIESHRKYQVKDKTNPAYGGILDGNDIAHAHGVTSFLQAGLCALVSKESAHYHSKALLGN